MSGYALSIVLPLIAFGLLTLLFVIYSVYLPVNIRKETCSICDGHGIVHSRFSRGEIADHPCERCGGSGTVIL
jgi:hypothetical protein